MRMRALAFCLTLIVVLAQLHVVLAQETTAPPRDWATVAAVPPGEELAVELKSGKTVKGKLSSVSDTRLSLSREIRTTDLDRNNIFRIYRMSGRSGVSPTLIGTGVGAGVGAAAGGVIIAVDETGEADEVAPAIALAALVGAGIGALTGFLIGKTRNNRVLIYESR